MPIYCKYDLPRLTYDQMREIDYRVMRCAFESHRHRGRLCEESVYQHDLAERLRHAGIDAHLEVPVTLTYENFRITLRIDLLVNYRAVYELKTADTLNAKHEAQCLTYLYLHNATRGKLINFRRRSVESRFVNTAWTIDQRRDFCLDTDRFSGDTALLDLIGDLLVDWGTGLWTSFYRDAIQLSVSRDALGKKRVPIFSGGHQIGYQTFYLLEPETALSVTSYPDPSIERSDFKKLVLSSRLHRLHWINITHGHVRITTLHRPH